jgi:hypothetical protein
MKVYLSNYRSHWISPYTIMEKIIFWREIDYDEPFIRKCNTILEPFCTVLMNILKVIHPKIDYVKIDRWDTWSMDHSLAHIILPMLKQLRDTKHGSPMVEDEDVPEELRSEDEEMVHDKWDYILNEMIWAFERKIKDDDENEFFDHTVSHGAPWDEDYVGPKVDWDGLKAHQARKTNGFRLLGKYYEGLWD